MTLILGAMNELSDGGVECMIRDWISWLRFLGFKLGETIPDRNATQPFGEKLAPPAPKGLIEREG